MGNTLIFPKEICKKIQKLYISNFTFIKLFKSGSTGYTDFHQFVNQKLVCKKWHGIINKFLLKSWSYKNLIPKQITPSFIKNLIKGNINEISYNSEWERMTIVILKTLDAKFVGIRIIDFDVENSNIVYAADFLLSINKNLLSPVCHKHQICFCIYIDLVCYSIFKNIFTTEARCSPLFQITHSKGDYLAYPCCCSNIETSFDFYPTSDVKNQLLDTDTKNAFVISVCKDVISAKDKI
jgi:hypothetical protein